jgi:hypothetical protein
LTPRLTHTAAQGPAFDRAFRRLCHIAALSRQNKPREALDQIVLTALALEAPEALSIARIRDAVEGYFGLVLLGSQVEASTGRLTSRRQVQRIDDSTFRATPVAKEAIEARGRAAAELEQAVKDEWLAELRSEFGTEVPESSLWTAVQRFLAAVFREHGAESVRLLQPPTETVADLSSFDALIEASANEGGLGQRTKLVRAALEIFLNHQTRLRTAYLTQLLDSTFTFFALAVDDATSALLRRSLPPLRVFLDTNFIFGLLDFHDNTLNELSQELVDGIKSGRLQFTLYYHERTLKEIRDTVFAIGQRLRSRRWSPALSAAAVSAHSLSGIELRYHQLNSQQAIDPDAFLSRYESFPTSLADLGVVLYRHDESDLQEKERWLLTAEFDAAVKRWRPARPKRYEAADHDVTLWMAARANRDNRAPTLASGSVVLTIDRIFHRFDRMLSARAHASAITVLPAQLLQVLRPFLPSTTEFDKRFVEAFTIPEFRSLVGGYAQTASKVMSYLATFADMPQATATKILRDEILLTDLRDKNEDSPEFKEIVDSALVAANVKLTETNAALVAGMTSERERRDAEAAALREQLDEQQEEITRLKTATQEAMRLATTANQTSMPSTDSNTGGGWQVRVSAGAVATVLLIVSAVAFWSVYQIQDGFKAAGIEGPLLDRVVAAVVGGVGACLSVLVVLVVIIGVVRGNPDFLKRSLGHRAFWAIGTIAFVGVLAVTWSIQV